MLPSPTLLRRNLGIKGLSIQQGAVQGDLSHISGPWSPSKDLERASLVMITASEESQSIGRREAGRFKFPNLA